MLWHSYPTPLAAIMSAGGRFFSTCYNAQQVYTRQRKEKPMDDENEELRDDIERVRGIDEGEADHRIGEFRDIVGRIEDLSAQLAAHNDAVMRRLDAIQGIASDNGADEGEGERGPETEDDDIDDITARDWDDLADELNI
jgi:hypothetical protein